MTEELKAAVESLYVTFAAYLLPEDTEPCPCCHTKEEEKQLHLYPLREMTIEALSSYSQSAILTWGGAEVFRHFLPRLFEIIAEAEDDIFGLSGPETLFSSLRYAEWNLWPDSEQQAIRDYFRVLWLARLQRPVGDGAYLDVERWICSIAQAENDLSKYLGIWEKADFPSAYLHLAQLVLDNGISLANLSAFWTERKSQRDQFLTWVKGPAVRAKLINSIDRWPGAPFAERLFETARILE